MDGLPPAKAPTHKLRVAFTESNIFNPIPEEAPFVRSSSLNGVVDHSTAKFGSRDNSWRNNLENFTIKGSLRNSWSLGFLFPDDEEHEELLQTLLDNDKDAHLRGDSSDEDDHLNDFDHDYESYGTWGSHHDVLPSTTERLGSGECRVSIPSSRSLPAALDKVGKQPGVVPNCKKSMHRCQTAPAMSTVTQEKRAATRLKRPQFEKGSSIVMQAGVGLIIYLTIGVLIYAWKSNEFSGLETYSIVDALYFCVVTMCTIGYGDIIPVTPFTKLFSCLFVLIGFGFIDALVSGMVTYVLDKQEHLLLSAVEGSHYRTAKKYFLNAKHGNRMRIRMKVGLALGVPVLCIFVGTMVMMQFEELSMIDAFYCTIMSVTTVGYGDHTFKTLYGRFFAAVWLLFSTLAVARCFLYLAEARVDKRHRLIAKWVLQRELTIGDLVQADLDHDGSIR